MRNSFEGTGEIRNESGVREHGMRAEAKQELGEKIALLLVAALAQPEMLALEAKNLDLSPEAVATVFAEKEYQERLSALIDRMRRVEAMLRENIDNSPKN